MRKSEAEDLAKLLAQKYNLPYLDLSRMTIDIDALKILPEEEASGGKLAVFQKVGQKLQVAIESPNPETTQRVLRNLQEKGYKINTFMVSEESLSRAWKRYSEVPVYEETLRGVIDVSSEKLDEFLKQTSTIEELRNLFITSATTQKKQENFGSAGNNSGRSVKRRRFRCPHRTAGKTSPPPLPAGRGAPRYLAV